MGWDMMCYRLVTGWYPSKNTAEKVLSKVKGTLIGAKIITDDIFFGVECGLFCDFTRAYSEKEKLKRKGVCCCCECIGDF